MGKSNTHLGTKSGNGLRELMLMALSLFMLITLLIIDKFSGDWESRVAVRAMAYGAAFIPVGLPIIVHALKEIAKGEIFNEYLLMTLAAVGAFYIGEYPEAVAVMLLYSIGEFFQERAVGKAQRDIEALINLTPKKVVVWRDGKRVESTPEVVLPGEMIEVSAGGRVPLDGILLERKALFDTSALTGESLPRTIEENGTVQAGMMTKESAIHLRVTKKYSDSAIARILDMVRDAASRKAPAELFIRRFARIYTPIVIALAVLIATVPPLLLGFAAHFDMFLNRALVFLVVSCPCALVISIPLGYFCGIGIASKRGILFKGGNYLDAVTKLDAVMFDKTGTLTQGQFEVERIHAEAGISEIELLAVMAGAESHSTHPLAKAIVEKALAAGAEMKNVEAVNEVGGMGIRAKMDGHELLVGNKRLMVSEKIRENWDAEDEDDTVVFCAADGRLLGSVFLRDVPKEDAQRAVKALKRLGMKTVGILSGDKTNIVAHLAEQLGVDDYRGDLMPEGKVDCIRQMLGSRRVAFVGDGINDAPVLALSNVGIAMGGAGSDATVETADIVIQGDQPSKVAEAIKIGQITQRVVKNNIIWAIGVKLLVLFFGAIGLVGLWWAVFADTGVALICVANVFTIQKIYSSFLLKK